MQKLYYEQSRPVLKAICGFATVSCIVSGELQLHAKINTNNQHDKICLENISILRAKGLLQL